MHYLLDGYNLLFHIKESQGTLHTQRNRLIHWLQAEFKRLSLQGTIVFDGAHRRDEESGLSYSSPLAIAYAPKGQNADSYILEHLSHSKTCKQTTVITDDRGLQRQVQSTGARTMSNESFIRWLYKKARSKKRKIKEPRESDYQINRLIQIFEERLSNELEDL